MFRWFLLINIVLGAAVLGAVALRNFPTLQRDIQRYISMRAM